MVYSTFCGSFTAGKFFTAEPVGKPRKEGTYTLPSQPTILKARNPDSS